MEQLGVVTSGQLNIACGSAAHGVQMLRNSLSELVIWILLNIVKEMVVQRITDRTVTLSN
jgi:hypothetical protein